MTGSTTSAERDGTPRSALREARAERGWSQAQAARALRDLAGRRAGPEASAASLKTQISRWENGHALPEPEYRALLAELYGRPPVRLGLLPTTTAAACPPAERLRTELAGAAAVDDDVLALWRTQLRGAARLDDELGATGAGGVVLALVGQLTRTLRHTPYPSLRPAVAGILSTAAVLAGRQALDTGDPDAAWRQLDTAAVAAQEARSADALLLAQLGRAEVLREIGLARTAVGLLDRIGPAPTTPGARTRLAAARGMTHAAVGDAPATHRVLDDVARWVAATSTPDVLHPGALDVELADVHRWHGRALLDLGDPRATDRLERALAARPRAARQRADLHADLALALAGADDAAAAGHARRARELAERIGSRRIAARLAVGGRAEGGR